MAARKIEITVYAEQHATYAEIEAALDHALADVNGVTSWRFTED